MGSCDDNQMTPGEFFTTKEISGLGKAALVCSATVILAPLGLFFAILAIVDLVSHPKKTTVDTIRCILIGLLLGGVVSYIQVPELYGMWTKWRAERKTEKHIQAEVAAINKKGRVGGERKPGATKTIPLPGGATMEMVWCPPGTFLMGSPIQEKDRMPNDHSRHPVTLAKGFWMAKTEVTQAQWRSVMGNNPSEHTGNDTLPVENVSWDDAEEFCKKAGLELPTEREWEYACRADSTGPYAGGGKLDSTGWYDKNGGGQTHPVGKKKANAWGLYDMHGNVWEFCADWYECGERRSSAEPGPHEARVIRGGASWYPAMACRAAMRFWCDPSARRLDTGFRPVAHQD